MTSIPQTLKPGDKVYYNSWSRIGDPKGHFIIAKGVIEGIKGDYAYVRRTDYQMPVQQVEIRRLKKCSENPSKSGSLLF